jgi:hypothetical protein
MIYSDLYGLEHDDLEKARGAIERVLGFRLEAHDSSYFGEYYLGTLSNEQQVRLQRNLDPIHDSQTDAPEEHYVEPEFQAFPILLYVSGNGVDAIRHQIEKSAVRLLFLRRKSSE